MNCRDWNVSCNVQLIKLEYYYIVYTYWSTIAMFLCWENDIQILSIRIEVYFLLNFVTINILVHASYESILYPAELF